MARICETFYEKIVIFHTILVRDEKRFTYTLDLSPTQLVGAIRKHNARYEILTQILNLETRITQNELILDEFYRNK